MRRAVPEHMLPVPRSVDDVRAHRIADDLWSLRLQLPYSSVATVNAFLLADGKRWVLVDCGSAVGPGWAGLERALALAGVEPDAIRQLALTHLHPDHAGLADEVAERLGCEVVRGEGPEALMDGLQDPLAPLEERRARGRREGVPEPELDLMVDTPIGLDVGCAPRVDALLREGDLVAGRWRVVPVPGHSPNQIALFDEERRWLLSADLALPHFLAYLEYGYTPDPYTEHLGAVERCLELRPALLVPGHGRPAQDAEERLRSSAETILEAAAKLEAVLDAEPRTAWELTLAYAGGAGGYDTRQAELSFALCVLEHLEARGRALAGADGGGVRRWRRER